MEMCYEVKLGYNNTHYFSDRESAGLFLMALLGDRSMEKEISVTLSHRPKIEIDWELLPGEEKNKYVSLKHFKYNVEKGDFQRAMDSKYLAYCEGKDWDKRMEKDKWLKKNGWYAEYNALVIPEIPPNVEVPGAMQAQGNDIEFGVSGDYREGNEGD